MLFPAPLLLLALLVASIGSLLPIALSSRPRASHAIACVTAGLASALALGGALEILSGAPPVRASLFVLPTLTDLALRVDALAAFFLALTGLVGLLVALYAYGSGREYLGRKNVAVLGGLLNAFLLSLGLVFAADDALVFLLAWEAMALSSFFLVAFEHEREEVRRASVRYAVMTHLGAGFLFAAFLALSGHGLGFEAIRASSRMLPEWLRDAAFVGVAIGFGTKAGVVPLHGWLPEAHPAAPSHVSALMSGVMIKCGVYGLLRVAFDLLGGGPAWWGGLILALGCATAVLGALSAVVAQDLKRLLAYSSIENVGIAFIALGGALLFAALGRPAIAALALAACLFHVLNHAVFKSLLFLGAGAVRHATHTTSLDQLGGLVRRMPVTAVCFLVGTMALAALPLLNGFVGEWLTFESLIAGFGIKTGLLNLWLPLAACALALTSGLALVAAVKAFGVGFLAKPRSEAAAHACEAGPSMRVAMGILALACLALGVLPARVLPLLDPILQRLVGASLPSVGLGFSLPGSEARFAPLPLACAVIAALALVWLLSRLGGTRERVAPTWACGGTLTARNQYSAGGYAQPLRQVFGRLLLPHVQEIEVEGGLSPVFKRGVRYRVHMEALVEKVFYGPVTRGTLEAAHRLTRIQGGSVHLYLAYLFAALLVVLALLRGLGV
ncbi:MAG TPA: proton-conducting transporter membrane subunit [Oscillatoriaceae cyanobacterium]